MKAAKWIAIAVVAYAGLVFTFESLLGYFQPASATTLVITTHDEGGAHDRVLAHIVSGGTSYVAANHWPRAWYRRALENPKVEATIDGEKKPYLAVPVDDAEHARVDGEHGLGLGFRFLTGFPPRYFLRLDPRPDARKQ